MKKVILSILLAIFAITGYSQSYVRDGNTIKQVKTVSHRSATHDSTTMYTFETDKGIRYPVYVGSKGSYYVWVKSAKGNLYKRYIKIDAK